MYSFNRGPCAHTHTHLDVRLSDITNIIAPIIVITYYNYYNSYYYYNALGPALRAIALQQPLNHYSPTFPVRPDAVIVITVLLEDRKLRGRSEGTEHETPEQIFQRVWVRLRERIVMAVMFAAKLR